MKKVNEVVPLIHRGTGGQQGWIYGVNGIISTLTYSMYKDSPKIVVEVKDDKKRK